MGSKGQEGKKKSFWLRRGKVEARDILLLKGGANHISYISKTWRIVNKNNQS